MRDNFEEWRAGPVEIDHAVLASARLVMEHLAGVFFEVRADDADFLGPGLGCNFKPTFVAHGLIVLADLIVFGQIGIVVVLAIPLGMTGDVTVKSQGCFHAEFEGVTVHNGQDAGHTDADGAGGGIGGQAKLGGTATEELGLSEKLDVDFEADDQLVGG